MPRVTIIWVHFGRGNANEAFLNFAVGLCFQTACQQQKNADGKATTIHGGSPEDETDDRESKFHARGEINVPQKINSGDLLDHRRALLPTGSKVIAFARR